MATVDFISGDYTIPAHSTQTFTFWWPSHRGEQPHGKYYFDVSISPQYDGVHQEMKPLVEVKKERDYTHTAHPLRTEYKFYLTLQNDNDFDVKFLANHVRVY